MATKFTIFAKSGGAISVADGKLPAEAFADELARKEGELNFSPKEEGFVKFPNTWPGKTFVITTVTPEVNGVRIVYLQESNEPAPDADVVG